MKTGTGARHQLVPEGLEVPIRQAPEPGPVNAPVPPPSGNGYRAPTGTSRFLASTKSGPAAYGKTTPCLSNGGTQGLAGACDSNASPSTAPASRNVADRLPTTSYTSIATSRYPTYGTLRKTGVICTEYAKALAERVVDTQGKLQLSDVSHMLDDIRSNANLPVHHRNQLVHMLSRLNSDPRLQSAITGICSEPGKQLRGAAADMVTATLNLPPNHGAPSKVDARRAVVMSLLGNLRQIDVASCFATAPANCMLHDVPERVALQLKELLEENKLTFDDGKRVFEVPLNRGVNLPRVRTAQQFSVATLHQQPDAEAALIALGIPGHDRRSVLSNALRELQMRGRLPDPDKCETSIEQIVERLAKDLPEQDKKIVAALDAIAGKEDVRLLRAWEYTLASSTETSSHGHGMAKLCNAATKPGALPEQQPRPELHTDVLKAFYGPLDNLTRVLTNGGADHKISGRIDSYLPSRLERLMRDHLFMQYDPSVKNDDMSEDGVSGYGGFSLFHRTDSDVVSRIDGAPSFQATMISLTDKAVESALADIDSLDGDPSVNCSAVRCHARGLRSCFKDDKWISYLALRLNPELAQRLTVDLEQCDKLPWKIGPGAVSEHLFNEASRAMIHGAPVPGRTDLQSMQAIVGTGYESFQSSMRSLGLREIPRHEYDAIGSNLLDYLQTMMNERFVVQPAGGSRNNDADTGAVHADATGKLAIKLQSTSGAVLDVSDPDSYRLAMKSLLQTACFITRSVFTDGDGASHRFAREKALSSMQHRLEKHIDTPGFIEQIAYQLNPQVKVRPVVDLDECARLPWVRRTGGNMAILLKSLGFPLGPFIKGELAQRHKGDAAHVIDYLADAVTNMHGSIQQAAAENPDIRLPLAGGPHAFSFFPMRQKGLGLDGTGSAGQWIDKVLRQPAEDAFKKTRTSPALIQLTDELRTVLGISEGQARAMYATIANKSGSGGRVGPGGHSYKLEVVHEVAQEFCGEHNVAPARREAAELKLVEKCPHTILADANWEDKETGEAAYLAAAYNPIKQQVMLKFVSEEGKFRSFAGDEWLHGAWYLSRPFQTLGGGEKHA